MMKIVIVIISLTLLISSCQNKKSSQQRTGTDVKYESHSFEINDTLNYVAQIDLKSTKDTIIDVLQYFNEDELPKLYRLGGVAYQPYSLNKNLTKVDLDFEGDGETLKSS